MWKVGEKEALGDAVIDDPLGAPSLAILAGGGDKLIAAGRAEVKGCGKDDRPAGRWHAASRQHRSQHRLPKKQLSAGFLEGNLAKSRLGELAIFQYPPRQR